MVAEQCCKYFVNNKWFLCLVAKCFNTRNIILVCALKFCPKNHSPPPHTHTLYRCMQYQRYNSTILQKQYSLIISPISGLQNQYLFFKEIWRILSFARGVLYTSDKRKIIPATSKALLQDTND